MLNITEAGKAKEGILWEDGERSERWLILYLLDGMSHGIDRGEFLSILRGFTTVVKPEQKLDTLIRQGDIEEW